MTRKTPRKGTVSAAASAFRDPVFGTAPRLTPASATALLVWAALTFAVLLGGAAVLDIDDVVAVPVRVEPSSQVRHIQHYEGGTVREILVREGDEVEENAVLLRLVNSQGAQDYAERWARWSAAKARVARLQADLAGTAAISWPADVKVDADTMRREVAVHSERLAHRTDQIAVISREIERRRREIVEMETRGDGLSRTVAKIAEEMAIKTRALEAGVAGRDEVMRLEREQLTLQGDRATIRESVERLRAQLRESEAKLAEFERGWRAGVLDEIAKVENEIRALGMTMAVAGDREVRSELRSPVHGIVKFSAITSVGQVAKPGDTLLDIVPLDDVLVVEARVPPQDIGHVRTGLPASVRLTAFDPFRFGSLDGEVTMVGADALDDARTGATYYKAVIAVHQSRLKDGRGREHAIRPGMVGTASVIVGQKSILRTVLEPLLKDSRL
ncbi:HlyD family type I secretion periplasmic adaptor subunit [Magnetospirillum sp. UT-4]|uniref:HlyD family type I secretion periplasmic adaptor subunit n=1 Tax=Magnetospirillum sp. UT-4 TaxID=2681467 RepID=UPI00137E5C73|nr:HlyD family type I secretion periplasmic adaptor subunit [Magnetospirillum sp. UT-4]CAA7611621.1 Membrane-fusion protein [Magnetospirillum sp. UT-4]